MGIKDPNNRIPTVDAGMATYTWSFLRSSAPGVGAELEHTKGDPYVTISFLEDEVSIPLRQVRWLAEVLLQISDFYREEYISDAGDDYNRDDLSIGDRR